MRSLYKPAFTAKWFHAAQSSGIGCGNCTHWKPMPGLKDNQGACERMTKEVECGDHVYQMHAIFPEDFGCFMFDPVEEGA